jgi:hypothetical protein
MDQGLEFTPIPLVLKKTEVKTDMYLFGITPSFSTSV